MNLPPHFVMSECRAEILSYIRGLILSGKAFRLKWAARDTGRSEKSIGSVLSYCRKHGVITCQHGSYQGIRAMRITITGMGSTPWPAAEDVRPRKDIVISPVSPRIGEDEIIRRRRDTEHAQKLRRSSYLGREFRGYSRHPDASINKQFFDKATVMALSGGTMTSLNM